jgi:hypothetical protein
MSNQVNKGFHLAALTTDADNALSRRDQAALGGDNDKGSS